MSIVYEYAILFYTFIYFFLRKMKLNTRHTVVKTIPAQAMVMKIAERAG